MVFASNCPGVRIVAGARGRRAVGGLMGDTKMLEIKGPVADWLRMGVKEKPVNEGVQKAAAVSSWWWCFETGNLGQGSLMGEKSMGRVDGEMLVEYPGDLELTV